MNVTVLDDNHDVVRGLNCFARLVEQGHVLIVWNDHCTDTDVLAQRLARTEVLMLMRERTPVRAALLERLPALRLITLNGVTPHIDLDACTRQGVAVSTRAYVSTATAELTWALVLMSVRRIPLEMKSLKAGRWQSAGMASGLNGRTLGVWGFGQIGQQVAGFGRAFGMRVQVWSREAGLQKARTEGFETASSKEMLFEASDVLSLHVRLAPETQGCVTAADLALMKPDALLVNSSRARLIEEGALVSALRAGRPGMAAVDVFEHEPMLDTTHPLLQMDNVICTPHLGYVERQQYEGMYGDQIERLFSFLQGSPASLVNPEVLTTDESSR